MKRQREADTENLQEPAIKKILTESDKIHLVFESDDVGGFKYLIANGLDLYNIKDDLHALHYAAREGSIEILKYLVLVLKIDISIPFKDGSVALHFAVGSEDLEALKCLMALGADMEIRDENGRTPLLLASFVGWNEGIELLINGGAYVDTQDHQGASPLNLAVMFQNFEIVKLLCDHGSNVNIQTQKKITPLCQAVHMGNLPICKYLVENGADLDLDASLLELLEELTNQEAWQQFALTIVKNYGLKVGISNLIIEKLTSCLLPKNFKELLIAEPEPGIMQANYDLETFETGLLYEGGKISSPMLFNAVKESFNDSFQGTGFKDIEEFYNKFPQYKVPGNYICELAQKDVDKPLQTSALFMLNSSYHKEIAESLLKQFISSEVRQALSYALKLHNGLSFTLENVENPIEIYEINIVEESTVQQQSYESKTTGDLNLDIDLS